MKQLVEILHDHKNLDTQFDRANTEQIIYLF